MKYLKHLAIYIFLALNAFGGWHDSAPFAAWPATNHLRWVDNVGVYTNASNPTNSGYGAWTNNYILTNWYNFNSGGYIHYWSFPIGDYASLSNVTLNAKETRIMDCVSALCERFLQAYPSQTVSNFWEFASPYTETQGYLLWRDERDVLAKLKYLISTEGGDGSGGMLTKFYPTPTNSVFTNLTAYTSESLCVAAGVPTNYLSYTPHRAADGSWTHYQRILTNAFVLRQGTNSTHVATNSLVDSAGIEFTVVGSNGTTVTRYATNVHQQAGVTLGAYGVDGLRKVITKLTTTAYSGGWTNNGFTNSWVGYSRQRPPGFPIQRIWFGGEQQTAWTNAHAQAYTNLLNQASNAVSTYATEVAGDSFGTDSDGGGNYEYVDAVHRITRSYIYATVQTNLSASLKFYGKTSGLLLNYDSFNIGVPVNWWYQVGTGTNDATLVISSTNAPPLFNAEAITNYPALDAAAYIGWQSTEAKVLATWDFEYK